MQPELPHLIKRIKAHPDIGDWDSLSLENFDYKIGLIANTLLTELLRLRYNIQLERGVEMIQVGDRFYTSWGYDQTNIDFLLVIGISPSGKTAKCRMASPINIGASGVYDALTPGQAYGEPFIMQIRDSCLRGSYPYCQGDKRLATFWKTQLGDTHWETNPLFGH